VSRTCQGKIEVPTEKELEALRALRSIKEQVRILKKRLSELHRYDRTKSAIEISNLKRELSHLKADWNQWEEKRQMAAKERMILLGHESPD
jgi:hypothetical protein